MAGILNGNAQEADDYHEEGRAQEACNGPVVSPCVPAEPGRGEEEQREEQHGRDGGGEEGNGFVQGDRWVPRSGFALADAIEVEGLDNGGAEGIPQDDEQDGAVPMSYIVSRTFNREI